MKGILYNSALRHKLYDLNTSQVYFNNTTYFDPIILALSTHGKNAIPTKIIQSGLKHLCATIQIIDDFIDLNN